MADYTLQLPGADIDARLAKVPQLESGLAQKQDTLQSGVNIKTVGGTSILGSGDIPIQPGDTNAVKYVSQSLTDAQKAQARTNIAAASAAELGQIVTDLTGIEADIDSLEAAVQAINVGDYITATTLPTASASTMGHIYLIGPDANNNYDRYFTQESGGTYSWVSLGSTQIVLSTYATKEEVTQLEAEQYVFYNLIWDNLGASAFWGEKPDIHFDANTVAVNITLATGLVMSNPAPIAYLGQPYSTRITAIHDYKLASVTCYMGGVEQTVVDGLIDIAEVNSSIVIVATAKSLDDTAFDGKTYRQIFETNNILGIPPGYDDGTFGTGMEISNGTPALTDQVYCTPGYSLHLPLGSPIAQTRTTSGVVASGKKTYIAMMVRVDTAGGTGGIGFQIGTQKSAKKTTSTGFVRWATKITTAPSSSSRVFLGVFDGSDIEGYVDSPVVVLEDYFTSAPSVDEWVALYDNYIAMKNH